MKLKFALAITCICLTFLTSAQSKKIDDRLLVKYTSEELRTIKKESPEQIQFLNYCIDNAFYVTDLPTEKANKNDGRIGSIVVKDIENINFFQLGVELVQDDYQYFAIEGTDRLLVVKSIDHIKKEMKQ